MNIDWKPWKGNATIAIGVVDSRYFLAETRYGGGDPRHHGINPLEFLIGFRVREVKSNGRFISEVAMVGPHADEVHQAIVEYINKDMAAK